MQEVLRGKAGVGVGQAWCPGCSRAPLGVTCMSPSGCPRTPRAKGREGRACSAGACKSHWSRTEWGWIGGGNGVDSGPGASDFGCLAPQGMFVEGPPGPEGPAVSILAALSFVRDIPCRRFCGLPGCIQTSTLKSPSNPSSNSRASAPETSATCSTFCLMRTSDFPSFCPSGIGWTPWHPGEPRPSWRPR